MKKALILLAAVGALATAGCANLVNDVCRTEAAAHAKYVTYVAPFRPAAKVALEAQNYAQISAACLTGDPFQVLKALTAAAKSLRK